MNASMRFHVLLLRVPPPLLFGVTFLAGIGMQRLMPVDVPSAELANAGQDVGIWLIGIGGVLSLLCIGILLAARTTIVPHRVASMLVTWGPYRFSRNPIYLSLALIYLGVAGIFAQIWPLVLLPLPIIVAQHVVIPFEEARLREKFGDTFEQYCRKVRRWL